LEIESSERRTQGTTGHKQELNIEKSRSHRSGKTPNVIENWGKGYYLSQNGEEDDDHHKEQITEPKPPDPPLQQAFPATRKKQTCNPGHAMGLRFTL
jgi:hypothetical protein